MSSFHCELVFQYLIPVIHYFINQVPITKLEDFNGIQHLLVGLQYVRVPITLINSIKGLLSDSSVLFITIFCLFTPFKLSSIGVVFVSLLIPAFKSTKLILNYRKLHFKKKQQQQQQIEFEKEEKIEKITFQNFFNSFFNWSNNSSTHINNEYDLVEKDLLFWFDYWTCIGVLLVCKTYSIIYL